MPCAFLSPDKNTASGCGPTAIRKNMIDDSDESDLEVRSGGSTSTGGAAAIHGFVYQILASIGQLTRAQFDSQAGRADIDTITAVLEPRAGGDLAIESAGLRVIQFKHRKSPVSVGIVGGKALPDLFRAHCDRVAAAYELHTTNGVSRPARVLIETLKKSGARPATDVEDRVGAAVNNLKAIHLATKGAIDGFEDSFATFMDRVVIAPALDTDQARREAIRFLEKHVPYREDAETALDALVGHLADRARHNDVEISVDDLLSRLELPGVVETGSAASRLADLVIAGLQARNFDSSIDVRAPISFDGTDGLTLVTGDSGCGKSWVLCRLADELARSGRPVVLAKAADRAELERQLQQAIGANALQLEKPVPAWGLGQTWRRLQEDPQATIAVLWEGCKDASILDDLRVNGGLGPGLSVVAEFPVSQSSRLADFKQVPTHHVAEFTPAQLFEAMDRRGLSAGSVPREIRRMLRLPVLAGMYATLALEMGHWDPSSEYRVLEEFWKRALRLSGRFGGVRLKALARRLVEGLRTSVTDEEAYTLGFSETELEALIGAGWLSSLEGHWLFAHERLLTWAIATALASDFDAGKVDALELAAQVRALQDGQNKAELSGLGFLLMDVVWLIAGKTRNVEEVAHFVGDFERDDRIGGVALYHELLPTAGPRVLGILEERARKVELKDQRLISHLTSAFLAMALDDGERESLVKRLWEGADGSRSIAIALGAHWPLLTQREALWELYGSQSMLGKFSRLRSNAAILSIEGALSIVIRADPSWLLRLIEKEQEPEHLCFLAEMINELDVAEGESIWKSCRAKLLEVMSTELQSILMRSIRRYPMEFDRKLLEQRIHAGDNSSRAALEALAEIDAPGTIAVIARHPPAEAIPCGRAWLDRLLDAPGGAAEEALSGWLLAIDPSGGEMASVWRAAEDRIDVKSIVLLLDKLTEIIDRPREPALRTLLELLGSPTLNPCNDACFHARRGSKLSAGLLSRIRAHVDGERDRQCVDASRLLRRIGGTEYELALLHALRFEDLEQASSGIVESVTCPTDAIATRLSEFAIGAAAHGRSDEIILDIWRALIAIRPAEWLPRLRALAESVDEASVIIALELIPEFTQPGDYELVSQCLDRSTAGSEIESRAISAALELGEPNDSMVSRAVSHIQTTPNAKVAAEWVNVLLRDRSTSGRMALDAYLAPLETATSWNSLDSQALAIRLGQGDAPPGLWRAGSRMVHRPSLSGENFIAAFLKKDRAQGMDLLLDRAFAPPDIFTNAQPDAIRLLSSVDKDLATEAFVQFWRDHPNRRVHVVKEARWLGGQALEAMIASLHEEHGQGGPNRTYRAACVVLRSRGERAREMVSSEYSSADAAQRIALSSALGWTVEKADDIRPLVESDMDDGVRRQLYATWRLWKRIEDAVEQFRKSPSWDLMEYAIDVSFPEPLCTLQDPLGVVDVIRENAFLMPFAEKRFAERLNALDGTKFKRVKLGERPSRK